MGTFSYTGGALSNLTGNTPGANVSNVVTLFNDVKTFVNGANIDATNLANNGVTAAKIEAQQAWQTIALTGFNASTPNLSYYKDSLGIVHFRGDALVVGGSNIAALATLCTLPAGYRPGSTPAAGQWFVAVNIGSTGGIPFLISPAGVVTLGTNILTANVTYSFGTTHFRAEN